MAGVDPKMTTAQVLYAKIAELAKESNVASDVEALSRAFASVASVAPSFEVADDGTAKKPTRSATFH
ncbi:hypothetical protein ACR5KS_03640 [Leucobacter sp. W1153]|uniref:hypothetical protein n=1 Tax=Leucobacter sp. W1153 TaxID=3439064 RepID=UPI003F3E45BD